MCFKGLSRKMNLQSLWGRRKPLFDSSASKGVMLVLASPLFILSLLLLLIRLLMLLLLCRWSLLEFRPFILLFSGRGCPNS